MLEKFYLCYSKLLVRKRLLVVVVLGVECNEAGVSGWNDEACVVTMAETASFCGAVVDVVVAESHPLNFPCSRAQQIPRGPLRGHVTDAARTPKA